MTASVSLLGGESAAAPMSTMPPRWISPRTRVAGYSGVEDVGGSFYLVRAKAKSRDALTPVAWGDLIDHLSGVDGMIARYDTPNMRGLGGWAKWGMSGDLWEVALAYGDPAPLEDVEDLEDLEDEDEAPAPQPPLIKGFRTAAAISFYGMSNQGDFPDTEAVSGSVSLLHEASGLNLTVAGGQRFFPKATRLNDGALGTPQDAFFYYIKPGVILDVVDAGHTAFYGEYGSWHDFLGAAADKEAVAGLVGFDETQVCSRGKACLVSGSQANIFGFGAVQRINAAEMNVFLSFRHFQADVDVVDKAGGRVPSPALNDFITVMAGAVIDF